MKSWIRLALLVAALATIPNVHAQNLSEVFAAYKRGDHSTAINGFRLAAARGDAVAEFMLGQMHAGGEGVKQDAQQAFNWFLKSAEQGYALAQANIGLSYSTGNGISKNEQLAFSWYRKAAEQGLAKAQARVGMAYFSATALRKTIRKPCCGRAKQPRKTTIGDKFYLEWRMHPAMALLEMTSNPTSGI